MDEILRRLNEGMIGRCGLKSEEEAQLLYEVCLKTPGRHLEIGTLWGGSAIIAGLAKSERYMVYPHARVFTVDPMRGGWWESGDPAVGRAPTAGDVLTNLGLWRVAGVVQVVRAARWEVEGMLPSFTNFTTALVDGDHVYEEVLGDWEFVRQWAYRVLFHDYDKEHEGVQFVVDEVVRKDEMWLEGRRAGSMVEFVKRLGMAK